MALDYTFVECGARGTLPQSATRPKPETLNISQRIECLAIKLGVEVCPNPNPSYLQFGCFHDLVLLQMSICLTQRKHELH